MSPHSVGADNYYEIVIHYYKLHCHERFHLREKIQQLPEGINRKLFEGSWTSEVILNLYGEQDSYFIPRGQKKARMYALKVIVPSAINVDSSNIADVLPAAKFALRKSKTLEGLKKTIRRVKDRCSLLMLWISTKYDPSTDLVNSSSKGYLHKIFGEFKILPAQIPVES